MKQYSKLFSLVALVGATTGILHADDNNNSGNRVVPFLQWRSQGRDTSMKLVGLTPYAIYQGDMDSCYGTFDISVKYDQNFRRNEITQALFGPAVVANAANTGTSTSNCNKSCDDAIVISGLLTSAGAAATRGPRELMAENFLLPRDYRSVVTFSPKVQDVIVNFDLFFGLDRWCHGMYFRLYGPFVWNKTNLRAEEAVVTAGTLGYPQGYFDPAGAVPTSSLFNRATQFFGGCTFPRATYTVDAGATAVAVQPLRFAKWSDCNLTTTTTTNNCNNPCDGDSHTKTGFAELRGELGYNYVRENCRFLINLQAAAPTGSKIKAEYLFPAYVGNGHHWELGVGLGGAWRMWSNEDMEKSFNFIVEADITHLFKAKQERTFDLKCKPLSRYMLAQRLLTPTATAQQLIPNTAIFDVFEAAGADYAPVANFSTRDVKVSIGVQCDLVAMFNYTCRGFSWDLGYNFWAMSSSKISIDCNDDCNTSCDSILPFPANTWALKGDASVAGFLEDASVVFGLGATESQATIFTGTNIFAGTAQVGGVNGTANYLTNPLIDAPRAQAQANVAGVATPLFAFAANGLTPFGAPINTTTTPVFISIDDLDVAGAEQRGLSHKIFTHFNYTWLNHERWVPYVGAGVSAEFGSHSGHDDCPPTTTLECDTCPSSLSWALSRWAVEIKGGVSFH